MLLQSETLGILQNVSSTFRHSRTTSDGYQYCLTIVDRFTRWPEIILIKNVTVETTAKQFFVNWIMEHHKELQLIKDED